MKGIYFYNKSLLCTETSTYFKREKKMIDTIRFTIAITDEQALDIYNCTVRNNSLTQQNTFSNGSSLFVFRFENLWGCVSSAGRLTISGSISKFYFGGFTGTLNRNNLIEALGIISEGLRVELCDPDNPAKLKRIDLHIDIPVKESVSTYTANFGDLKNTSRLDQNHSGLLYRAGKYSFNIYNKSEEVATKNREDPILKHDPVIRFEFRALKDVKGVLSLGKGTLDEITKKEVWDYLVGFLEKKYFAIERKNQLKYDLDDLEITTPSPDYS